MIIRVADYTEFRSVSLERLGNYPAWEILSFYVDKSQPMAIIGKPPMPVDEDLGDSMF